MRTVALLFISSLVVNVASAVPAEKALHPLYGEIAYDFYTGNQTDALTRLLVAEEKKINLKHGLNPEILKGGLLQSLGLPRTATKIFEKYEDVIVADEDGVLTWLYLGKAWYEGEQFQKAFELLSRIDAEELYKHYPAHLDDYRYYMALSRMRVGDKSLDWQQVIDDAPRDSFMRTYLLYNLGVTLFKQGKQAELIERVIQAINWDLLADSPEKKALQNQVEHLIAFVFTKKGESDPLSLVLSENLTLDEINAESLWSYASNTFLKGETENTLKTLAYLIDRFPDSSVSDQAVMLFAENVEKQREVAVARNIWMRAASITERHKNEIDQLQNLSAQVVSLLSSDNAQAPKEMFSAYQMRHVVEWIDQPQNMYKLDELIDLTGMVSRLHTWQQVLASYQELMNDRINFYHQQSDIVATRMTEFDVHRTEQQRQKLAARVETIIEGKDIWALLDEEQKEYYALIGSVEKRLHLLKDESLKAEFSEKLRKVRGVLLWEASEQYFDKAWGLQTSLRKLNQEVATMQGAYQHLQAILKQDSELLLMDGRLKALQKRTDVTLQKMYRLRTQTSKVLIANLQSYMVDKSRYLDQLNTHALFAYARLTDVQFRNVRTQSKEPAIEVDDDQPAHTAAERPQTPMDGGL